MSPILLQSLFLALLLLTSLWGVSLIRRDVSIVDPFWGTGFVILGWFVFLRTQAPQIAVPGRVWLILSLTTLWGLRLSLHLLWRNWGHEEDRRYRAMRDYHGLRFWWVSLLTVFWLQCVILWVVSLPVQVTLIHRSEASVNWFDVFGGILCLTGIFFEAVGDYQMAVFQSDRKNAGRVMDRGLWRYTRHPNYFGDFCVWWGLYLIAANGGAAWTIFSPLLMSFLLLKVSGVTLLEKTITSRRPEYAEYQRQTNAFFPGPPRIRPNGS